MENQSHGVGIDATKLIAGVALILAASASIIGFFATIPMLIGVIIGFAIKDTSPVFWTTLFGQIATLCVTIFLLYLEIFESGIFNEFDHEPSFLIVVMLVSAFAIVILLLEQCWRKPISRFILRRVDAERSIPRHKEGATTPIVQHAGLSSYSSADELLKWKRMLDEGVIDQPEFDAAKKTILKRS